MSKTVGILAVQGDVQAHARALERLGAAVVPVLFEKELERIDAIVLPGGESTTMSKGLERLGLREPLAARIREGLPVLGTCAGAILLAREVRNHPVPVLGTMDMIAVRNAYGTQVDSFAAPVDPATNGDLANLRCVFIRAPRLESPGPEVEVLARVDGLPVLLRQGHMLAATFHPELTDDTRVHAMLLNGR